MSKKIQKSKTQIDKITIIGIAIVVFLFLTSAGAFAYQVYLENINNDYSSENDDCFDSPLKCVRVDKPVLYLYPTKTEDIKVSLQFNGKLMTTYPDYNKSINGWDVTANPDGSLINHDDNLAYSYIFWEGIPNTDFSKFNTGFIVKGSETKAFLQKTLKDIGLTAKEYNEMIVYWLPKMENNKYNLIHFAGKEYTDNAKLSISPTPDSMLRVFMVYKAVDNYQQITPQTISGFERKGFSVVEWGGTEVK